MRHNDDHHHEAHGECPTCGYYHFTSEERKGMLRAVLYVLGAGAALGLMFGWIIWGIGLD